VVNERSRRIIRPCARNRYMDREHINPAGVFKHGAFTRVVTVKGPMKLIFIAGQTPSDENYQPVARGDYRGQYLKVMENLDIQSGWRGLGRRCLPADIRH
jgi:enamine deaminase RidA (YjgF/YER057c/UK114 family)